jgi:hypothetical protein
MSAVEELNDECFSMATELVAQLCEAFEDEIERKPTIGELCEILTWGIRSCATDILHDINVENLVEIKPKVSKRRKITLTPGDLLSIPASNGVCFLTVYLGLFRISGDAMGILSGRHACRPPSPDFKPQPTALPIFFHKLGVTTGRWTVVGHLENWRDLFPNPPEYFYAKRYYKDLESIGPFGSAETSRDFDSPVGESSPLRALSEEEAHAIGLLDNDFFQSGLMEAVEAHLQRIL